MFIERIVSQGLAHFSYIAGNNDEAFVVDSKRDVDQYIEIGKNNCCGIIHSDRLDFGYGEPATENDTFYIGGMKIRIIETISCTDRA